jgi:hypothetical protein
MDPLFIRSRIMEELGLLASAHAQLRYEQRVPIAHIPSELVCGWLDDIYQPNNLEFQQAFSRNELSALADFSAVLHKNSRVLPDSARELVKQPGWQLVMRSAREVLDVLEHPGVGS